MSDSDYPKDKGKAWSIHGIPTLAAAIAAVLSQVSTQSPASSALTDFAKTYSIMTTTSSISRPTITLPAPFILSPANSTSMLASHGSHRSHASHASHASGSSPSYIPSYTPSPTPAYVPPKPLVSQPKSVPAAPAIKPGVIYEVTTYDGKVFKGTVIKSEGKLIISMEEGMVKVAEENVKTIVEAK